MSIINHIQAIAANLLGKERPKQSNEYLSGEAQALKNNPAYEEARLAILTNLMISWVATSPSETSKREQLYYEVCALGKIQAELNLFVFNAQNEKDNGNAQS
jgi:hypothetical protein